MLSRYENGYVFGADGQTLQAVGDSSSEPYALASSGMPVPTSQIHIEANYCLLALDGARPTVSASCGSNDTGVFFPCQPNSGRICRTLGKPSGQGGETTFATNTGMYLVTLDWTCYGSTMLLRTDYQGSVPTNSVRHY